MIINKEHLKDLDLEETVLVTGCFNLYHPGHVHFLRGAKSIGKNLIVAVAHDKIAKIKRVPVLTQVQRMYVVNSHESVDYVIPEDNKLPPDNIKDIVEILCPTYWITNSDNPNLNIYKALFKDHLTTIRIGIRKDSGIFDISTTSMIEDIIKQYNIPKTK